MVIGKGHQSCGCIRLDTILHSILSCSQRNIDIHIATQHQCFLSIKVVRNAVITWCKVDDVPSAIKGCLTLQVCPCIPHRQSIRTDREQVHQSSILVYVVKVCKGSLCAILLVHQTIEERTKAAIQGDGIFHLPLLS